MMPKGGDIIWGNSTYAADDIADMIKGMQCIYYTVYIVYTAYGIQCLYCVYNRVYSVSCYL
jgi:hypothetical protein